MRVWPFGTVLLAAVIVTFAYPACARAATPAPAPAATSAPDATPSPSITPTQQATPTPVTTPMPGTPGRAITLKPRLTQFYQGLTAGQDPLGFEYGAKVDLWVNADLAKLGLWRGLSMTIHPEYNFGATVNGRGGVLVPVNTALTFPGTNDFDMTSVYFAQTFNSSTALLVGKMNMVDLSASAPFKGGAGIDSFWNITFAAPPSGTVPPYLFGALLNWRTKGPAYGLWVYDPESKVDQSGLDDPFANGVTIRASIEFPIGITHRPGHQGFVALYSTQPGTDLATYGDVYLPPPPPGTVGIKDSRYYFNYTFDQYLYQSKADPKQNWGIFGQFGISDGNPNRLYWSAFTGVGGTGLISGRSEDNWGVGVFDDAPSKYLTQALAPTEAIKNGYGSEVFYDFAIARGLTLGADVQIFRPSLATATAIVPGLRLVIEP